MLVRNSVIEDNAIPIEETWQAASITIHKVNQ